MTFLLTKVSWQPSSASIPCLWGSQQLPQSTICLYLWRKYAMIRAQIIRKIITATRPQIYLPLFCLLTTCFIEASLCDTLLLILPLLCGFLLSLSSVKWYIMMSLINFLKCVWLFSSWHCSSNLITTCSVCFLMGRCCSVWPILWYSSCNSCLFSLMI